jgi:hypothetical protein
MTKRREASPLKKHIASFPQMQELRKNRRASRARVAIFVSIGCVALVSLLVYVSHLSQLRISDVRVEGNQIVDTEDIVAVAREAMSGSYLFAFPKNNSMLVSKSAIVTLLETRYPRLRDITITRNGFTSLSIHVAETRGTALYCGEAPGGDCYFMDAVGKIVALAPFYSGNVYLRFYGGTVAEGSSPLGQRYLPEEAYLALYGFGTDIRALGLPIAGFSTTGSGESTALLDVSGTSNAVVRFMAGSDYALLVNNLHAALGTEPLKTEIATKKNKLQYFDLRFTNKVYYKFSE